MHKELIPYWHIGSYSAFLLLALVAGYVLARWRAVRIGIRGSHLDNLALLIAFASLLGARFFSWWFYFPPGSSLRDAMVSPTGGMVFYGGLLAALAATILYCLLTRLSQGDILDALAPGVCVGLALGRVGCFLAGCCWGDVCASRADLALLPSRDTAWQVSTVPALSGPRFPMAVRFPRESGAFEQHVRLGLVEPGAARSLPVHPVQLYEAVLALVLGVALHLGFPRRRFPGDVVCALAVGYGVIRFAVEFLRADNSPAYLGLTLSQVISLLMGLGGTAVWWSRRVRWVAGNPGRSMPA